jgi:hypothetical protein
MKFPDSPERTTKYVWYGVGLAIAAIFLLPGIIFVAALVKAFVISTLWHWYIVPFFHVADMPMAIAFGLSLMINYIIPTRDNFKDLKTGEKFLHIFLAPAVVLLFGWVGTYFI